MNQGQCVSKLLNWLIWPIDTKEKNESWNPDSKLPGGFFVVSILKIGRSAVLSNQLSGSKPGNTSHQETNIEAWHIENN